MMPLTARRQIDELRRHLHESEQRRHAAELKLADRERQLGKMTAELAGLRGKATASVLSAYALDFPHMFKSNNER